MTFELLESEVVLIYTYLQSVCSLRICCMYSLKLALGIMDVARGWGEVQTNPPLYICILYS